MIDLVHQVPYWCDLLPPLPNHLQDVENTIFDTHAVTSQAFIAMAFSPLSLG